MIYIKYLNYYLILKISDFLPLDIIVIVFIINYI